MDIHYFAAARAAAGTPRETLDGNYVTVDDVLNEAATRHAGTTDAGMDLAEIFERCTFLLDGQRAERSAQLGGAQRLDVLPPFAGG